MQNSEYWAKRFEMLQEKQFQNAEKYLKELEIQYKKAYISLEEKISKWYTRLAVNNQVSLDDAKKLLSNNELEEFKWTLEEYIEKGKTNGLSEEWTKQLENASARVHINKLQAMQIQIQAEIEQLYQKQSIDVIDLEDEIYTDTYYESVYEIQKGNRIAWPIPAIPKELINEVISKPWTTDNLTFSDRIWKNKNELNYALQTQLTQAIIRGDGLDNLIKSISKQFNVSRNKAGRLVMTESAFFSSAAQKKCFENLSVKQYEIVATLDSHTSNICQELDGKVFDMKDYSVGITAPPFHVYCRSVTAPYFEDNYTERIARDKNGKTYYVPGDMTYKEWEAKYVTNSDNSGIISKKLGNSHGGNWGGTGKGQFVEKINKNEVYEKLLEYENDIRNMKIEYGILIDKDYNVFAYTGTETNLDILDRSLDNAILTHNHPDVASFGKDDFELLINNKLKELRAVDKEYTYSLKILKKIDKPYNYFYKKGSDIAFNEEEEMQHCAMLELEKEGYVKYDRIRKETKN